MADRSRSTDLGDASEATRFTIITDEVTDEPLELEPNEAPPYNLDNVPRVRFGLS